MRSEFEFKDYSKVLIHNIYVVHVDFKYKPSIVVDKDT